MAPYGYEYKQNRSSQSVQWNGFTGTIPFVFKTETNSWVKGRECYLNTKIRIVQTDSLNTHGTLRAISDNNYQLSIYSKKCNKHTIQHRKDFSQRQTNFKPERNSCNKHTL